MSDGDFNRAIDAELAEFFGSIEAENAALAAKDARIAELEEALREIRDQDDTDMVLDPDWSRRRARAVLEKGTRT